MQIRMAPLLLRIAAFAPAVWSLLLLAITAARAMQRRRARGAIRLETHANEDEEETLKRDRPLFSVFVTDEDVLEASGLSHDAADAIEEDASLAAVAEAILPPTPLLVVLVPLAEVLAWAVVSLAYIVEYRGPVVVFSLLAALSHVFAWGFALATQLRRRTSTAPLGLLSLYVVILLDALLAVVQQLRRLSHEHAHITSLTRLPDLVATAIVIASICGMPITAPLEIAVKPDSLEGGNESETRTMRPRSPEDANTVWGALSYSWMSGLMYTARTRALHPLDVWALSLNNRAEVLSRRFGALKSKTLTRKLLRASARDIAIDATLKLVAVSSEYLRPFFIQKILENLTLAYLSKPSFGTAMKEGDALPPWSPIEKAYLYTFLAFLSALVKTLAQQRHFHYARRIGMRLRSELTIALFEKALRRRDKAGAVEGGEINGQSANASVGKVVSMISDDVNRVLRMGCDSHLIYGAPLEIVLGLIFLYNLMGWSALVGVFLLVLSSPINFRIGKWAVGIVRQRQTARDARQTALQELMADIRTVKLFGWSEAWIARVEEKRNEELKWLLRDWLARFSYTAIWAIVTMLVPLASFWAYTKIQGEDLTVAVAFTALSLFSLIRGPLDQIPGFGIRILQLGVSISRMESFFEEEEVSSHAEAQERRRHDRLRLENATLRYAGAPEGKIAIENASVEFPEGRLTVISGPTGSGKTSLLLGLLGELEVIRGTVELPASVSYAAQHPWLESLSVKDNITFGYDFDQKRYDQVLEACALERDLELLPDGEATFVGERGISLSGGQKARLALARAIYAPTSFVLLDDIFSAVDAHTARHLLEKAFRGPLLRGRTCVLVTHHVDLVLPAASYHIQLEKGRIAKQGPVDNAATADLLDTKDGYSPPSPVVEHPVPQKDAKASAPLTGSKAEGWSMGNVKTDMYRKYLSTSGLLFWSLALLFLILRPGLGFLEQFWLRKWGEASSAGEVDSSYFLIGYAIISSATASTTLFNEIFCMVASMSASRTLFQQLLTRVVHAPLRWFDLVPLGTISNRFTNDISAIDDAVARNVNMFLSNICKIVTALVVSTLVLPASLATTLVFAVVYVQIFRSFLLLSRDANRIASTTASPLFASFGEALRGIVTIRAFGKQHDYRSRLCHIVDETLAFWYLGATLDIWLSIRTQLLSAFCFLTTAVFATFFRISPGLAGIAITSSQLLIQALDTLCNSYGRLVLSMNSLERITEYLEVPQEPSGDAEPPAAWPTSTASAPMVEIRDLQISYDPSLPPVLNGVSFSAKAGERIGIVGRTGSGKSTLAMALLRFAEPLGGKITIGGINITQVSIDRLRQRISLVPQEACLFEGSLRDNLDPFREHSDEACITALERSHLFEEREPAAESAVSTLGTAATGEVDSLPKPQEITLDTRVAAGGANWSAGQRQLIAMARALLRDSRVVILDESSASLDQDLDEKLQLVIRAEFEGAVVLTIAHRLRTIIDYDRVLVLDAGRIVENDTPANLLARPDGVFRRMWETSEGTGTSTPRP
ncbi:hypothetical protein JCM10908_006564 [Rhodotorula pacifica]|uniref:uncharacterized protein n=1 Tax=Rhodotorula pacifica TaxID=1495444 RepID=UPI00317659DB